MNKEREQAQHRLGGTLKDTRLGYTWKRVMGVRDEAVDDMGDPIDTTYPEDAADRRYRETWRYK